MSPKVQTFSVETHFIVTILTLHYQSFASCASRRDIRTSGRFSDNLSARRMFHRLLAPFSGIPLASNRGSPNSVAQASGLIPLTRKQNLATINVPEVSKGTNLAFLSYLAFCFWLLSAGNNFRGVAY